MCKKGYFMSAVIALVCVLALAITCSYVIINSNNTAEAESRVLPDWMPDDAIWSGNGCCYYQIVEGGARLVYATSVLDGVIPTIIDGYTVVEVGSNAFHYEGNGYGFGNGYITVPSTIRYIGADAFVDFYRGAFFIEGDTTGFDPNWNSTNLPYATNCTYEVKISATNRPYYYLKSFENENLYNRENGTMWFGYLVESGYTGYGVAFDEAGTGTRYRALKDIPEGTGTLYTVVEKTKPTSGSSSCVAEGTLITLADGSQVPVETLTGSEELLVWDMFNGTYATAPILFIDSDEEATYEIIELTFSDNTVVKVISEHAFFDVDAQEYVFLRADAAKYVGHTFNKGDVNVELVAVNVYDEVTTTYSPVTNSALCYYVNGMLSMPGNTEAFINIFAVEDMKVNAELMAQDIATYGLYTYEEFCSEVVEVPQEVFEAFNGQYLKVSMGKGLTTVDEVKALFDRYGSFFAEEPVEEVSVLDQIVNAIVSAFNSLLKIFGLNK